MKAALILAVLMTVSVFLSVCMAADDLYFIDVHNQADENIELNQILQYMETAGVSKMFLMARNERSLSSILDFAAKHPQRIMAMAPTKIREFERIWTGICGK